MFDERLVIPSAVAREVFAGAPALTWIRIVPLTGVLDPTASPTLGSGEREAIAVAIEQQAALIILDDLPARRLAASRGLSVIGTVGVRSRRRESG